jgi:thiol-disulfide isomerase/thioredoxin
LLAVVYLVLGHTWSSRPRIAVVSAEAWSRELAARRGSVVVVPVWASWCERCAEMLPALAEVSTRYSERGVLFVSLCLDDPARKQDIDAAERIVVAANARFPHFLPEREIADSLEALAIRDLPAVLVYNESGDLMYRLEADHWTEEFSPADVEDAIESLVGEIGTTDGDR